MNDDQDPSDAELVQRTLAGDETAWEQLIRRHAASLAAYLGSRIANYELVERHVEMTIGIARRYLGDLVGRRSFASWLRSVGASVAIRFHKRHPEIALQRSFPSQRGAEGEPQIQRMRQVEAALGQLAETHRMALELSYRGGLSGPALAEALHVADGAQAEQRIEDALAALATLLPPLDHQAP